jgi:hypothetical protein
MRTYKEFRPTAFDANIPFDDERDDWLVLPISQTRDSGPFEQANFQAALNMLGGEGEPVEVHRYGHWGPGWFEIIIVDPNSPEAATANDIEASLENYPVLDDELLSQMEYDDMRDSWQGYGEFDFRDQLVREADLSDDAADALMDVDADVVFDVFCDNGGEWEHHADGCYFVWSHMDWQAVADELLTDYKSGLLEQLRYKAWVGVVDRFADVMRAFWDDVDVSVEDIEAVVLT